MKLTKLMLSASVAALALVSCNKEEGPSVDGNYKSVEIEIANLFMTKSTGDFIADGTPITLNNLRLYLTDGSAIYYDATNELGETLAETAYQFAPTATNPLPETISYHFVNPRVTKVVALANLTDEQYATIEDYEDIQDLKLQINKEQNPDALALFDEATLVATGNQHFPQGDTHKQNANEITNVYEADLKLVPRVARFELDGFAFNFSKETPKYNKITIYQVAFNNYYPTVDLSTGAEEGTLVDCLAEEQVKAVQYLTGNTGNEWYFDKFELVLERPATMDNDTWVNQQLAEDLYYHMFPNPDVAVEPETAGYPELMFQLSAEDTAGNTTATYIYTKRFRNGNEVIKTFEEGKIYRMNAAGLTDGEGDVPFGEDDIEQLARCLDITVTVEDWNVILVTPEF